MMPPNASFPYTLKRNPRSRGIRLSVNRQREVIVSAAPWISEREIQKFVEKQSDWISQTLAKIKVKKNVDDEQTVELFGKSYHKVIAAPLTKVGVVIQGEEIIISPTDPTRSSAQKSLEHFLKSCAQDYILPRLHTLAATMGITFTSAGFRQQSSRWGSCSSRGHLSFNWRLVHFSPPVIDYVLIHELAHRREMNHGTHFWEIVAQYDPEYRAHQGVLKRAGWGEGE